MLVDSQERCRPSLNGELLLQEAELADWVSAFLRLGLADSQNEQA